MFDFTCAIKKPAVLALGVVLVCVGCAGTFYVLVRAGKIASPLFLQNQQAATELTREERGGALEAASIPRSKDRSGLASTISPDGMWRIGIEEAGSPDISIEHALVARRVSDSGKKVVLATVADDLGLQNVDVQLHAWEPAGWSADGSTVYFAERILRLGSKTGEYTSSVYGNTLYKVKATGGEATRVGTFSTGKDADTNGLVAVAPAQKRVAYLEEGVLYTSLFDGKEKKKVFTAPEGKQLWQAVFDPSGSRLAVLLMEQKADEAIWTAGMLNENGTLQDLGMSVNGGLMDWTKTAGLAYLALHPDGTFEAKTTGAME